MLNYFQWTFFVPFFEVRCCMSSEHWEYHLLKVYWLRCRAYTTSLALNFHHGGFFWSVYWALLIPQPAADTISTRGETRQDSRNKPRIVPVRNSKAPPLVIRSGQRTVNRMASRLSWSFYPLISLAPSAVRAVVDVFSGRDFIYLAMKHINYGKWECWKEWIKYLMQWN